MAYIKALIEDLDTGDSSVKTQIEGFGQRYIESHLTELPEVLRSKIRCSVEVDCVSFFILHREVYAVGESVRGILIGLKAFDEKLKESFSGARMKITGWKAERHATWLTQILPIVTWFIGTFAVGKLCLKISIIISVAFVALYVLYFCSDRLMIALYQRRHKWR